MKENRIGIICPSEIAFRRFLPALEKSDFFKYAGVAIASSEEWGGNYTDEIKSAELEKAQNFKNTYNGKIFESYSDLIESPEIDSVYLPLPPALHYKWGEKVLKAGKHLFLEKPSTTTADDTAKLIKLALEKNLAIHENYMFRFHSQIDYIRDFVKQGSIGDVRLIRISFGFPKRATGDFRYNKSLGGGALLDAGGYTLRLATILLGNTAKITTSNLNYTKDYDVDIYGSATMVNDDGVTAQLSFGMDNCYKCDLEIWGSTGNLFTNRILTAPVGFEPTIEFKNGNEPIEKIVLKEDDSFFKSIEYFSKCITDIDERNISYKEIQKQADLVETFRREN